MPRSAEIESTAGLYSAATGTWTQLAVSGWEPARAEGIFPTEQDTSSPSFIPFSCNVVTDLVQTRN